ncbi:hypothetical protein FRB91_007901 [Serendipita sp. 411]|nr:hypothetical protein FRB91_007901 [Serendipita sp. 411]
MNPPANASPAPFPSTISSSDNFWIGYIWGVSGFAELTTTVESAPRVIITTRGLAKFDFGNKEIARATAAWSLGSGRPAALPQDSASDSLPRTKSVKGRMVSNCTLKCCGINGADKFNAMI